MHFSHPDSNCRLRSFTESAFRLAGFTAGGDFHPALKMRSLTLYAVFTRLA